GIKQALQDLHRILIGMGHHLVPIAAEGADIRLLIGMNGKEFRLGLLPCAAPVLLQVPFMGADIFEKPAAPLGIGDEAPEGNFRVVMDEDLADVENDVANFAHFLEVLLAFVAPGMAASITFLITVGSASPSRSAGFDHQWPAGAGRCSTSAR